MYTARHETIFHDAAPPQYASHKLAKVFGRKYNRSACLRETTDRDVPLPSDLPVHLLNLGLVAFQRGRALHRPLGRPPHGLVPGREHDQVPGHPRLLVVLRIAFFDGGPDALDEMHPLRRSHRVAVLLVMVVVVAADVAFVLDGDLEELGMLGC